MKFRKRTTITAALIAAAFLASRAATAVPTLQLASADAGFYDATTESWFIEAAPGESFDLQVIGATTPDHVDYISHLNLFIAVPTWDDSMNITISAPMTAANSTFYNLPSPPPAAAEDPLHQPFTSVSLTTASSGDPATDPHLWNGHPNDTGLFGGANFPSHDVYSDGPVTFWSVPLPLLDVAGAGETVYDHNEYFSDPDGDGIPEPHPEVGSDSGDAHHLDFVVNAPAGTLLHMDVVGLAHNGHKMWRFAPFSHDVDVSVVPEPASAALIALGLVGVYIRRRRN